MVVGCIIGLGSRCCCVNSVGSYDLYSFVEVFVVTCMFGVCY